MDWEGSEKVNVNVLKDNFVCRMSFLHNDFYRPSTWQGRHFYFKALLFFRSLWLWLRVRLDCDNIIARHKMN